MLDRLAALPELRDVTRDLQDAGPRDAAHRPRCRARLGIAPRRSTTRSTTRSASDRSRRSSRQLNQYRVILEVEPRFQQSTDALKQLYVRSPNRPAGAAVSLLAQVENERSRRCRSTIKGSFPSVTLSFNLAPGMRWATRSRRSERASARSASRDLRSRHSRAPRRCSETRSSNQPYLIAAALIAVYIVLGVLYESYIHPLTILSTLPSAGVGALLALISARTDLSSSRMIGIILLIGIVKKNAIMMIDFALMRSASAGMPPTERSDRPACCVPSDHDDDDGGIARALPLALGTGAGSELRRPSASRSSAD